MISASYSLTIARFMSSLMGSGHHIELRFDRLVY